MNPHKFSAIAHRDHDYCNPIAAGKIERLLDLLPLDETSRVLDLGCGRAELALRIIERFGSTVVAVDRSSMMLDAARERAEWTGALGKLHLDDVDIADYRADPENFHLTVMLGAGGIKGGMTGICNRLKHWTRSGGYVLIGEGFWRQKPHSEYLSLLGGEKDTQFLDHRGNVQAGIDAGLIPMHATTASMDEWDEYEWKYCRAIERYVREQPEDPDIPAMLERSRRWRDAYLKLGARHTRLCRLPFLPAGLADGLMAVASAGDSGKPLWQKLGLKDGTRLYVAHAPATWPRLLAGAPEGVVRLSRLGELDIAILFVTSRAALAAALARTLPKLGPGGMIWVAWPKKASGVVSDVTEDTVRAVALPMGVVDVKVCAIDATWSGLKLVRRRAPAAQP